MAESRQVVEHEGIVKDITGRDVYVELLKTSACGSCEAKDRCGLAESQYKVLVFQDAGTGYFIGQKVMVVLEESQGIRALVLAYLLPLLIVVFSILFYSIFVKQEYLVGLCALFMLIPYYLLLYLFRHKLKQSFRMKLYPDSTHL